jgi:hypothetical protein
MVDFDVVDDVGHAKTIQQHDENGHGRMRISE